MSDQSDRPRQTGESKAGCGLILAVLGAIVVVGLIVSAVSGGSGDSYLGDDEARARVETSFGVCLEEIGLSVDDATVEHLPDSMYHGDKASRVTLTDGAAFDVGVARTKGAIVVNDQANSDVDAGGC